MKTVLVVDDSSIIQKSIDISLSNSDLNIIYAFNAQEALNLTEQHQPDLFILDVSLPDQNGFELCTHIRSIAGHEHTPVIMLGSAQSPFNEAQLQKVAAQDYILKPFETSELSEKVHGYLHHLSSPPTRDEESFFTPKEPSKHQAQKTVESSYDIGFSSVEDIGFSSPTEGHFDTKRTSTAFDPHQTQHEISDFAFDNSELTGIDPSSDLESISNPFSNDIDLESKREESTDVNYQRSSIHSNISEISADSFARANNKLEEQTSAYVKSDGDQDMSLYAQPVETNIVENQDILDTQSYHPYQNSHTDIVYSDPAQKTSAEKDLHAAQGSSELKLSDQQIESIVTKVFENVIERIAWEIVPDIAEKMIREEIKRLTKD